MLLVPSPLCMYYMLHVVKFAPWLAQDSPLFLAVHKITIVQQIAKSY